MADVVAKRRVKRLVNVRIDTDLLEAFDAKCAESGKSRTAAIEHLMRRVVAERAKQATVTRPDPVMAEGPKPWNPRA